ncbi:hypothetical protein, variant [Sphaeroforma arctica JP610]|uniref:25S rRNA (uridine-N(3))-methyltransferase BMT5-like domain-containing protein n=1 Tax=Sphaeroforma arctica JP610 TaxID=667725 RepID=A0A0L0FWU5_9EUKA|nr:hypothetical protein, variant [Sphaeroforma arctica JP610]KNC81315.1 hypothetical protein, variant [Sphaeroforma arctica JP610]|eukprot:XP_014155217.1 hypothetical protein, variant [Sphaeroforma arctica JP610]
MGARERANAKKKKKQIAKKQILKVRKHEKLPAQSIGQLPILDKDEHFSKSRRRGDCPDVVAAQKKKLSNNEDNVCTYGANQKILVVGDGDFGFSAGLVSHCKGKGSNIVATSYDKAKELTEKYGERATRHIQAIESKGGAVAHGVDATELKQTLPKKLSQKKFDCVVFNFPHTGKQRVHLNRKLLLDFFISAKQMVQPGGEIRCTLKNKPPYSGWEIRKQADVAGNLGPAVEKRFDFSLFKGYRHMTTEPDAKKFDAFEKHCVTYCFVVSNNEPIISDIDVSLFV